MPNTKAYSVARSGLTLIQTTSTGGSVSSINFGSNAANYLR